MKTVHPRGIESRTTYDLFDHTVKTIANYVDGTVSDLDDKTTEYTYSAAGMTKLQANLTRSDSETVSAHSQIQANTNRNGNVYTVGHDVLGRVVNRLGLLIRSSVTEIGKMDYLSS